MQQIVVTVVGVLLCLPLDSANGRSMPGPEAGSSCMVKWIQLLPSTRSASQSRRSGRLLSLVSKLTPVDEGSVDSVDQNLISDVLGGEERAREFKSCLGRTSENCRLNAPCRNGGRCLYSPSAVDFLCQCEAGFTGVFCDIGMTPCASAPCQNGGTCATNGSSYTCQCPVHVSGKHCHHRWIDEGKFSQLRQGFIGMSKRLDKLEARADQDSLLQQSKLNQFLSQLSKKLTSQLDTGLAAINSRFDQLSRQTSSTPQQRPTPTTAPVSDLPGECRRGTRGTTSGVFTAQRDFGRYTAYCDRQTDGGGWTVMQRRQDGSVSFRRNWADSKNGFGIPSAEYWLGLETIHRLTSQPGQRIELRIDMTFATGGRKHFAHYSTFSIGPESEGYQLRLAGFSSPTLEDGLVPSLNGMSFSTPDNDNDPYGGNCAVSYGASWWYRSCGFSTLNGHYGLPDGQAGGCSWTPNPSGGNNRALKFVEMKFRRAV